eukprot:GFKZ01003780.1.p1 GENE.GFKZ01003780.1~~GFKZ01003780.1.p1  ORF type:complete len:1167 (-),score=138.21 GFKZ01003780.1:312-3812(-)
MQFSASPLFQITSNGPPFRHCYCCNTTSSYRWHTGPDGFNTLCSSCGTQYENLRLTLYRNSRSGQISASRQPNTNPVAVIGFYSMAQNQFQHPFDSDTRSGTQQDLTKPIVIPKYPPQSHENRLYHHQQPRLHPSVASIGRLNGGPTIQNVSNGGQSLHWETYNNPQPGHQKFVQPSPGNAPLLAQFSHTDCPAQSQGHGRTELLRSDAQEASQQLASKYSSASGPVFVGANVASGLIPVHQHVSGAVHRNRALPSQFLHARNLPRVQEIAQRETATCEMDNLRGEFDCVQQLQMHERPPIMGGSGSNHRAGEMEMPAVALTQAASTIPAFGAEKSLRPWAGSGDIVENGVYRRNMRAHLMPRGTQESGVMSPDVGRQAATDTCGTGTYFLGGKLPAGFNGLWPHCGASQKELQHIEHRTPQVGAVSVKRAVVEEYRYPPLPEVVRSTPHVSVVSVQRAVGEEHQSQSLREVVPQQNVSVPTETHELSKANCRPAVQVISRGLLRNLNRAAVNGGDCSERHRTVRSAESGEAIVESSPSGSERLSPEQIGYLNGSQAERENVPNGASAMAWRGTEKCDRTQQQRNIVVRGQPQGRCVPRDHAPMVTRDTANPGRSPDGMIGPLENPAKLHADNDPQRCVLRVPLITSRKKLLRHVRNQESIETMKADVHGTPRGAPFSLMTLKHGTLPRAHAKPHPQQEKPEVTSEATSSGEPGGIVEVETGSQSDNSENLQPTAPPQEQRKFARFRKRRPAKRRKKNSGDEDYVPDGIELGEGEWSEGSAEAEDPPTPLAMISDMDFESDDGDGDQGRRGFGDGDKVVEQDKNVRKNGRAQKSVGHRQGGNRKIIVIDDDEVDVKSAAGGKSKEIGQKVATDATTAHDGEVPEAVNQTETGCATRVRTYKRRLNEGNGVDFKPEGPRACDAKNPEDSDHVDVRHPPTVPIIASDSFPPSTVRLDMSMLRKSCVTAAQGLKFAEGRAARVTLPQSGMSADRKGDLEFKFQSTVNMLEGGIDDSPQAARQHAVHESMLSRHAELAKLDTKSRCEGRSKDFRRCSREEMSCKGEGLMGANKISEPRIEKNAPCRAKRELRFEAGASKHPPCPQDVVVEKKIEPEAAGLREALDSDVNALGTTQGAARQEGNSLTGRGREGRFPRKSVPSSVKLECVDV